MSTAQKETLRKEAIRHRNRIDPGSEDLEAVVDIFYKAVQPEANQIVSFYWPKGREFHPGALIERFTKDGISCVLPVVRGDSKILEFYKWDESKTLEKGPYGIMQPDITTDEKPVLPDIVIVPLLAFDRKGHRLGYGSGYYDATLKDLRSKKDIIAVGLAYAQQAVLFNLPSEPHDQRLDWIVTPQKAHDHRDRL